MVQQEDIATILLREFPQGLSDRLGRVKEYEAPRVRFHSQVPSDGGKQADFLRGAKPIIKQHLLEWIQMGVVRTVDRQSVCTSPLLLISNEGKIGFRLYHNLRMLNSVTVKKWGSLMNKHSNRIQLIPKGCLFSSFDLSKRFLQIPISISDQKYSGFYLWDKFMCLLDSCKG